MYEKRHIVCSYVCTEYWDSHWRIFLEIFCLVFLLKFDHAFGIWLKYDNKCEPWCGYIPVFMT
jgi:hypothetical protein